MNLTNQNLFPIPIIVLWMGNTHSNLILFTSVFDALKYGPSITSSNFHSCQIPSIPSLYQNGCFHCCSPCGRTKSVIKENKRKENCWQDLVFDINMKTIEGEIYEIVLFEMIIIYCSANKMK